MTLILLYIKTRLNEGGEFKASELINTWLKNVLDRYFIWFYIVSVLTYFSMVSFAAIGYGAEKTIQMLVNQERVPILNFYKYISVLILGSLFFKLLSDTAMKQNPTFFCLINLYFQTPIKRLLELKKMIFFNGYGFRILVSSVIAIPVVIPAYFSPNNYLNMVIAYTALIFAIFLLNSIETLLYLLEQKLKVNGAVFTIILFVVGFLATTFFNSIDEIGMIDFSIVAGLLLCSSIGVDYYVKTKL